MSRQAGVVGEITGEFFKWLSLPNYDTVEIVAATVIANRLPGEPLWLAVVGPSSCGKTEIVRALDGMNRVHSVDKIGPATWVSGFKAAQESKEKKVRPNGSGGETETPAYGLLTKMMDGQPHIVTVEDFSTVLSKRREVKGEVLGDLRKLYDGKYTAPFGNGVYMEWTGKIGMIVCSTGQYDQQVADLATFGERFCIWRAVSGNAEQVAERSGRNSENSGEMRARLAGAMAKLDTIELPKDSVKLSLDARTLISRLTAFVALCRTPVPRDPYKRDVVTVPEPEGTGRLSAQLHQLLRGLVVLYGHSEVTQREVELVQECAFSTIPSIRRRVMEVMDLRSPTPGRVLERDAKLPHAVCARTLEDMNLLGVIESVQPGRHISSAGWQPIKKWKPFFHHVQARREDTYE